MKKIELNSLDLEVKRMMLETPSLFPSRIHCLEFIFCTIGTGYKWQPDGTLKDYNGRDRRTPATPMPKHIEKAEPYDFRITKGVLDDVEAVRIEYEDLTRGFREKHIDFLCSTPHTIGEEYHFMRVYPMSWEYSPMCIAAQNPHRIADEWRAGIREFIHWYLPKVNGQYGCFNDPDTKEPQVELIKDPRVRENYIMCRKVLKMLMTDTDYKEAKTLMTYTKKFTSKLLAEIKREEKDD